MMVRFGGRFLPKLGPLSRPFFSSAADARPERLSSIGAGALSTGMAGLRTEIWVKAQLRIADLQARPLVLRRRGDANAGVVLVVLNRLDGMAQVLSQTRDATGERAWFRATGPDWIDEAAAEAFIERQVRYDPDLWVLEYETPSGAAPFDEPIL